MGMCRLPHVVEKHARQERRGGVADRHNDLVQRLHLRDLISAAVLPHPEGPGRPLSISQQRSCGRAKVVAGCQHA